MAQSSSSCSQRSSSVTTCTSCTKKKKKKGAASSDSIDTLTRGRSSKQDVYFLHKGPKRFSYLLSLSSSDSKPLPLSSPNEDSSPEPILSESRLSRPRSTPSIVVHTQSVRKERPWKNRQEALSDLPSSSDNSKASDGNPWLSWYGWTLLLIAQQLNAITTRSGHGLMRKWRQKFIRTGMRIHVCKNIEGLKWWSKDLLVDKLQVAGGQLRNPPVKFRLERRLHLAIEQLPTCSVTSRTHFDRRIACKIVQSDPLPWQRAVEKWYAPLAWQRAVDRRGQRWKGMWEQQSSIRIWAGTSLHPNLGAARLGQDLPGPARILMLDCLYPVSPNLAPAWTLTSEFDRINWPMTSAHVSCNGRVLKSSFGV